ncbi:MAG: PAS domain S-box protein, partial [Alkalispirochaeta sp.]
MTTTSRKTILLVEDEALIAMAEQATLERNGYTVVVAHTGEKALSTVRENQEIDLVLMDIDLGRGMSGTEAAELILLERHLPLVFLSSHTEEEIVAQTEGITSYGYIVKNSGNTVLLASIRMAFKLFEARTELLEQKDRLKDALAREEHANERLLETSEELERYFSNSLDMLCIANTDGEFVRLNPEWERVLGYPLSELENRPVMDLVHPEDRDETIRVLTDLAGQREVVNFENRYRCADGSYRWIEWRSRPVGTMIYAAARDITDHKRAEDALRDSEAMFRNLMENSIDAVQLLDEDGRFLDVNKVACEMIGYTRDELLTMRIADIDPNYPGEGFASFWHGQQKGSSILFETIHRHKNGTLIPVEVNGIFFELRERKMLFGVARDIRGRKHAESELHQQAALQQLIMTIATELIDVPLDEVDSRVDWMLQEVGTFKGFDRVFVFYNDFDRGVSTNTHEWCAPGITPEIDNLQAVPLSELSAIMDNHRRNEAYWVQRVAELPEGDPVRAILDAQDIKSTLLLPLMHGGTNIGFVGFDAVREEWSITESTVNLLRVMAKLISHTEVRRQEETAQRDAERVVRESEARFRELLDGIQEVPVQGFAPDGTVRYWNL